MSDHTTPASPRTRLRLGLLVLVLLTAAVYWPGLGGGFLFDDHPNITKNSAIQLTQFEARGLWEAALSSHSGRLGRPVSMASFALNHLASGASAFGYKATNLVIHITVGLSLGWLTHLLLAGPRMGGLGPGQRGALILLTTGLWLLHPFNLTGVLYVVQRMTSLAALFSVWACALYALGRLRQLAGRTGWPWLLAGVLLCVPLATFSKENGALAVLLLFLVEWLAFGFRSPTRSRRLGLITLFGVCLAAPAGLLVIYTIWSPDWLFAGYANREFGVWERLLTQSRVVVWYLRMILVPDIGSMALLHDEFRPSLSLMAPYTTLPSVAMVTTLLAAAMALHRRQPFVSFGIFWFFAGHMLESTVIPLEMVYEHRNYLPAYGALLVVAFGVVRLSGRFELRRLGTTVAVLWIALLAVATFVRSDQWSSEYQFLVTEVRHHPDSPRNHALLAEFYAARVNSDPARREALIELARQHYLASLEHDPQMASSLIGLIVLHSHNGIPGDAAWLPELNRQVASGPIPASTVNGIGGLTECLVQSKCDLDGDRYTALIEATQTNPNLSASYASTILSYAAAYWGKRHHDYARAAEYEARAVAKHPRKLILRFNLAAWLAELGRYDEAQANLDEIRRIDTKRQQARKLVDWEERILALQTSIRTH